MKWKKILLTGFALLSIPFLFIAWYLGIVHLFDGPARARLRHALDLPILPSGLKVNGWGVESWTGYFIMIDISLPPDQFDKLLSNRQFTKETYLPEPKQTSAPSYLIPNYQGFVSTDLWTWYHFPPGASPSGHDASCFVRTNKQRDRALVIFSAE